MDQTSQENTRAHPEEIHRLLIVDDDHAVRRSVRLALIDAGYAADTAQDSDEASRLLSIFNYDLVLTDIKMPGRSGLELVAEVREMQPSAAIVVFTAYPSLGSTIEAIRLKADDYLIKPIKLEDLYACIGRVLERRAREQSRTATASQLLLLHTVLEGVLQETGINLLVTDDAGVILFANRLLDGAFEDGLMGKSIYHFQEDKSESELPWSNIVTVIEKAAAQNSDRTGYQLEIPPEKFGPELSEAFQSKVAITARLIRSADRNYAITFLRPSDSPILDDQNSKLQGEIEASRAGVKWIADRFSGPLTGLLLASQAGLRQAQTGGTDPYLLKNIEQESQKLRKAVNEALEASKEPEFNFSNFQPPSVTG